MKELKAVWGDMVVSERRKKEFETEFIRKTRSEEENFSVECDKYTGEDNFEHYSLRSDYQGNIKLCFDNCKSLKHDKDFGWILKFDSKLLIIPKSPKIIFEDSEGRIEDVEETEFSIEFKQERAVLQTANHNSEGSWHLGILALKDKTEFNIDRIERRKYSGSDRVSMSSIRDFWDDYIFHYTFNPSYKPPNFKKKCRFKSEGVAWGWYLIFRYLYRTTGKDLYNFLSAELAVNTRKRLENGRWRHGAWTDEMETHARWQCNGIFLLIDFYEVKGNESYLKSAKSAIKYLISISEDINEGTWYLHDSLENREELHEFYSQNHVSTSFGKSKTNTLTLNTHLFTLASIQRFHQVSTDDFEKKYREGINALKSVMEYKEYDLAFRALLAFYNPGKESSLQLFVNSAVGSLLMKLKKVFPRLCLPNGFVERDLDRSSLNTFYNVVNLYDLALLSYLDEDIADSLEDDINGCLDFMEGAPHYTNTLSSESGIFLLNSVSLLGLSGQRLEIVFSKVKEIGYDHIPVEIFFPGRSTVQGEILTTKEDGLLPLPLFREGKLSEVCLINNSDETKEFELTNGKVSIKPGEIEILDHSSF